MGDVAVLLVPLLLLVVGTLVFFVGCTGFQRIGFANVELSLDLTGTTGIDWVKFTINIEDIAKAIILTKGSEPSPDAETFVYQGKYDSWDTDGVGEYAVKVTHALNGTWDVLCEAEGEDGTQYSYFNAATPNRQMVLADEHTYRFRFRVNADKDIEVKPPDSDTADVVLSLTYGGTGEATLDKTEAEKAVFTVKVDGHDEMLTLRKESVSPKPFLGVTPVDSVDFPDITRSGDWEVTLPKVATNTWEVSCEFWTLSDTTEASYEYAGGQPLKSALDAGKQNRFDFKLVSGPTRTLPK